MMKSKLCGAQIVRVSEHGQLTDPQNSLSKAPVQWNPNIYFSQAWNQGYKLVGSRAGPHKRGFGTLLMLS